MNIDILEAEWFQNNTSLIREPHHTSEVARGSDAV